MSRALQRVPGASVTPDETGATFTGCSDDDLMLMVGQSPRGEAAFCEIVRRYQHFARSIAQALLRRSDDAEDAVSMAMWRIYRKAKTSGYRPQNKFRAYLGKYVRLVCRERIRRRR